MKAQCIKLASVTGAGKIYFPKQRVRWRVLSAFALFATDATVADRVPSLRVASSDGAVVGLFHPSVAVSASSSVSLTWARGVETAAITGNVLTISLPDMWFDPTWSVWITGGIVTDAFDAVSAVIQLSNE